jgi:uncharacterized membrane protein YpjA
MADLFIERRPNLVVLVVLGFLASALGVWYYWPQLMGKPVWLWAFVMDCPVYVSLFSLVLILKLAGRISSGLNLLVSAGIIKYGIWTLAVMALHPSACAANPGLTAFIVFTHILMLLAGIVLFNYIEPGLKAGVVVVIWFLFNDLMDYSAGAVPAVPSQVFVNEILSASILCSVLVPAAILLVVRSRSTQS